MKQLRFFICSILFISFFQVQFVQGQTAPADIDYVVDVGGSYSSNVNAEFAMAINPQNAFPAIPAAAEFIVIMFIPTSQVTGNEAFTILDDATNGGSINFQGPGFPHTDGNTYFSFVYSGTGINLSTFGSGSYELIFSVDVANGNPSAVWSVADGSTGLFTDFGIRSALNVSGFNELALTTNAPLPVELVDFQANAVDGKSLLTWQTATELNNEGFEVQHSTDGQDWHALDFVEGRGTASVFNEYRYLHQQPKGGDNYYRLKQMDYDGDFDYSNIEVVSWTSTGLELQLFPNPVSDVLNVNVQKEYRKGSYQLYSSTGQLVRNNILNGDTQLQVQLDDLPRGSYMIQIIMDEERVVRNIIIQ